MAMIPTNIFECLQGAKHITCISSFIFPKPFRGQVYLTVLQVKELQLGESKFTKAKCLVGSMPSLEAKLTMEAELLTVTLCGWGGVKGQAENADNCN